ncbi:MULTISPECIES: disulfide bond formation protein B [Cytobacillus]|uniref:disulfide bond formation protein B n=1 Tax=Cytobacillus TaxID=2675230 RepID=UPI0028896301|nr:disulfide bond formation protein B [Cytobacillus firmus]
MNRNQLVIPFVVSLTATLGSLYFSEIKGYIPCELCWWQRIINVSDSTITWSSTLKK